MTRIRIRPLAPDHDTEDFRCGDPGLDRFLKQYAYRNQEEFRLGVTYVATGESDRVIGFVALASASLEPDDLPPASSDKPRYPLPVIRLARLAVDRGHQGRGLGRRLVRFTFSMAMRQAAALGCVGVTVDALPEAVGFYEGLGFEAMDALVGESAVRPVPLPMFVSITKILGAQR